MKTPIRLMVAAACLHQEYAIVSGFIPAFHSRPAFKATGGVKTTSLSSTALGSSIEAEKHQPVSSESADSGDESFDVASPSSSVVRAPLKFVGPYPCLALRFPHLATSSQRSRNETGISLDFVLDTAANTNTINAQVATGTKLDSPLTTKFPYSFLCALLTPIVMSLF